MAASKDLFFSILREALWQRGENLPKTLSKETRESLLDLAEQQTVTGMIADVVLHNGVELPENVYYDMVGIHIQMEYRNRLVNNGVGELVELLDGRNIDYVMVKGQTVASYYPNPMMRVPGDIDYYCDKENFQRSVQAVKDAWNVEFEMNNSDKHVHYNYKDIAYEGHFALVSLYNKKRNDFWQQLLDNDEGTTANVEECSVKTLSPTLHVLYIFLHLYHHLLALGIGLRQFCDMAVMLHYAKNDIDMDALRFHLKTFGMERAYRACGSILVDYLGLPEKELGYTLLDSDRRYGKRILDVVFYRGNMGHSNKRNGFKGWKHKVEAMGIKLAHFAKFAPLAPKYSYGWILNEVKKLY